ncbi:MAG: hypothetical protein HOV66_16740 [Streptomycetaceae bacterium]|nr:hypothetical protein [Streptomycetaceae bacterium]
MMERTMSPRKPTVDDLDDTDDQDGIQEDEKRQDSDLKLRPRKPDEVDLGGVEEDQEDEPQTGR